MGGYEARECRYLDHHEVVLTSLKGKRGMAWTSDKGFWGVKGVSSSVGPLRGGSG